MFLSYSVQNCSSWRLALKDTGVGIYMLILIRTNSTLMFEVLTRRRSILPMYSSYSSHRFEVPRGSYVIFLFVFPRNRSKRGCSGGNPCEQCEKRGKNCAYAQRRMSGPRGRPSGHSHRVRSRAKARRQQKRVEELKSAGGTMTTTAAVVPQQAESVFESQRSRLRQLNRAPEGIESGSEYTPSDGCDSDFENSMVAPVAIGGITVPALLGPGQGQRSASPQVVSARRPRRISLTAAMAAARQGGFAHVDNYDSDIDCMPPDAVVPDEPVTAGVKKQLSVRPSLDIVGPTCSATLSATAAALFGHDLVPDGISQVQNISASRAQSVPIQAQSPVSARQLPRTVSCPPPLPPVPVPGASMLADAGVILPPSKRTRVVSSLPSSTGDFLATLASASASAPTAASVADDLEIKQVPSVKYGKGNNFFLSAKHRKPSFECLTPPSPTKLAPKGTMLSSDSATEAASAPPSLVPYDDFETGAQTRACLLTDVSSDSMEMPTLQQPVLRPVELTVQKQPQQVHQPQSQPIHRHSQRVHQQPQPIQQQLQPIQQQPIQQQQQPVQQQQQLKQIEQQSLAQEQCLPVEDKLLGSSRPERILHQQHQQARPRNVQSVRYMQSVQQGLSRSAQKPGLCTESLTKQNPVLVQDYPSQQSMPVWKASKDTVEIVADNFLETSYTTIAPVPDHELVLDIGAPVFTSPTPLPETFPSAPCLSGTVSAGTDLWEEFVDLECATLASTTVTLARQGSLMRAMEAVGTEIGLPSTTCEPGLFADMW